MKKRLINAVILIALGSTTSLMAGFANTDRLLAQAKKEAGEMEPTTLKKMIDKEEAVVVLDIRESEQRAEGEIYADESYAITRGNLEFEIGNKIKDGLKGWAKAGYPVETGLGTVVLNKDE